MGAIGKMAEYRKVCENPRCGKQFIAKRRDKRYCCGSCREWVSSNAKKMVGGTKKFGSVRNVRKAAKTLAEEAAVFDLAVKEKPERVPSALRRKFGEMRDGEWKRQIESMSKRMRMRVAGDEGRSGLLWEKWQQWVLSKFTREDQDGGWLIFTVTSESGREGPVRTVVKALGELGLQGVVFYEGGGWNTWETRNGSTGMGWCGRRHRRLGHY